MAGEDLNKTKKPETRSDYIQRVFPSWLAGPANAVDQLVNPFRKVSDALTNPETITKPTGTLQKKPLE